jgi:hypothetical protein
VGQSSHDPITVQWWIPSAENQFNTWVFWGTNSNTEYLPNLLWSCSQWIAYLTTMFVID